MNDRAADVIVIGAGVAGLTAAIALSDAGMVVEVLERERVPGGRASSFTDERTGDRVPIGPHIVLDRYPSFLRLLERCETAGEIAWQGRKLVTIADGERAIEVEQSRLPPPLTLLPSFAADPELRLREVASNWRVVMRAIGGRAERLERFDRMSARELLEECGVSEAFIERVWAFTALAIVNAPLERCSAAALLRFVRAMVSTRLEIGLPAQGLAELYAPAAERIVRARGGRIRLGTSARRIVFDQRARGVELESGELRPASTVIAAVPPAALAKLVPPDFARALSLERFEPVRYVSVFLWFDEKLGDRAFWARANAPDSFNTDFYDLSNIYRDCTRGSIIASNMIAADRFWQLADEELVSATEREIREFVPAAGTSHVVHARVHRIPLAIPLAAPGIEALRPSADTTIRGLHLAGDWTATGLPFSMESAARSGFAAAESVIAHSSDVAQPGKSGLARGGPSGFAARHSLALPSNGVSAKPSDV